MAARGEPLFIAVQEALVLVASPAVGHTLQALRLSSLQHFGLSSCSLQAPELELNSCGAMTQPLRSTWNLPRPRTEPSPPALAVDRLGLLSTITKETFWRGCGLCWAFAAAHGLSSYPIACGNISSWSGMEPRSPALQRGFSITEPTGSSHKVMIQEHSVLGLPELHPQKTLRKKWGPSVQKFPSVFSLERPLWKADENLTCKCNHVLIEHPFSSKKLAVIFGDVCKINITL